MENTAQIEEAKAPAEQELQFVFVYGSLRPDGESGHKDTIIKTPGLYA